MADAADFLDGKPAAVRVTAVNIPEHIDVRALREAVGATQVEFSRRFAIPVDTLRKWERGVREPDAAGRAYLALIKRDPKAVEALLVGP
ncbi:helix-turn-helix domain-containing protein [Azospirillum sp. RWY-5-1]|uniref:Helix-turn-helix domain-containing protein n=1 Tax=Azospirillum oleiclasticum TaxID=2735135 RepID=A0ABX2T621_9PROT|nr:helix-turn-helix domain-containing protein [Azospirillum oleiclasticum]NYZ10933.1 helix-turn-helix domain-containing protein [Azospirillum oleiclasticum]NYZ18095.1 helix-turn-helix domain-containing protein [Azospirillum oleiclasticum]